MMCRCNPLRGSLPRTSGPTHDAGMEGRQCETGCTSMLQIDHEIVLALGRVIAEAADATGPEEALWCFTRASPGPLGHPAAASRPHAFREPQPPEIGVAAVCFMRMPDGAHHLITAPVNFPPAQHHELVDIGLGHPGVVARLQPAAAAARYRAAPRLRQRSCRQDLPRRFGDVRATAIGAGAHRRRADLCQRRSRHLRRGRPGRAGTSFAHAAAACWMGRPAGSAWLAALDTSGLPVRKRLSTAACPAAAHRAVARHHPLQRSAGMTLIDLSREITHKMPRLPEPSRWSSSRPFSTP